MISDDGAVAESAAEHALFFRAEFFEHSIPAQVHVDGASLEPVDAEVRKHRIEHQARATFEQTAAPERRSEREAPFRGREPALDRPHLNDADGPSRAGRNQAEAGDLAATPFRVRPANESMESTSRGRTRRGVAPDARVVEVRHERAGIAAPKLPQRDRVVAQLGEAGPPVGGRRKGFVGIDDRFAEGQ